jgi:hypothetical protein
MTRFLKTLAWAAVITTIIIGGVWTCAGCGHNVKPYMPDGKALNAIGTSLARADAYVDAASTNVSAAKPGTDSAGRAHLDSATDNLDHAKGELTETAKALESERKAHWECAAAVKTRDAEIASLKSSWGHRFQVIVTRFSIIAGIIGLALLITSFTSFSIPGLIGMGVRFLISLVFRRRTA